MPTAPIHHHLNLTGQDVLTYGSWGLTAFLIVVAIRLGGKEKGTPFYLFLVLAAMVAALAEPLYDTAFSLYFYSTRGKIRTITALGRRQPICTDIGYAMTYAAPAVYIN